MILWKSKEINEVRVYSNGEQYPCLAFRWIFQISLTKQFGFSIGFEHQHKSRLTNEWNSSHVDVFCFNITKHFAFGQSHYYYDGPHCLYSFGPFHIQWGGGGLKGKCSKC